MFSLNSNPKFQAPGEAGVLEGGGGGGRGGRGGGGEEEERRRNGGGGGGEVVEKGEGVVEKEE